MICNSIEIPKESVIIISESNTNINIKRKLYCKSILSIYYRKGKKNSASNKNYGFKYTHCSYISFFDADDVMYNNRINILHYIINKYPEYDIIMHKYTRTLNNSKKKYFC